MANINEFRTFAMGGSADVHDAAAWNALGARTNGFVTGTADSTDCNTAWRQGTTMAAVLGQIIADTGADALHTDTVAQLVTKLIAALEATIEPRMPPGWYGQFAGAGTPPGRWLRCNGAVVLRATYPDLFAAIGTTYNTGGESGTQFRLPDKRGTFDRDADEGRGLDPLRALNNVPQPDTIKLHGHPFRTGRGNGDPDSDGGLAMDREGLQEDHPAFTGTLTGTRGEQIGGTGDTETRPINTVSRWYIAY